MAILCMFDIICETFIPCVPCWYHRQVLLLDEYIRMIYGTNEIWDEKVWKFAFKEK